MTSGRDAGQCTRDKSGETPTRHARAINLHFNLFFLRCISSLNSSLRIYRQHLVKKISRDAFHLITGEVAESVVAKVAYAGQSPRGFDKHSFSRLAQNRQLISTIPSQG